jgi:hypothetical protein
MYFKIIPQLPANIRNGHFAYDHGSHFVYGHGSHFAYGHGSHFLFDI